MNGGARVAEVLKANGVEFLFTLCGGHISPILVESKRRGIRIVDTRHEVNAVFAADATSRLTGVPGVAAVTAGPGVTNAITAVKNCQLAQSPLVLIGGATATMLRGRGSLQDIDQMSLIRPHVKWAARPNNIREVLPAIEKAFEVCQSGVPGPVFVELAVDLLYEPETVQEWYKAKTDKPNKTPFEHVMSTYIRGHLKYLFTEPFDAKISPPPTRRPKAPNLVQLKRAASLVGGAQRPIMVLGSQTMLHPRRRAELVDAVERLGVPVYLSGMARGLLGKGHPLQKRHKRRNALKESDVCILVGVPCDFRLDYGSHVSRSKVLSVNLSEEDLNKNRRPEIGVKADPHTFLVRLADELSGRGQNIDSWMATLDERDAARETEIDGMAETEMSAEGETRLNPLRFFRQFEAQLSDNSIMIGDGGDWVASAAYTTSPRAPYSWLDPGVFGTLGVGAGFALGAKLVNPKADVWLIYGDGAAGFSIAEYDTFVRHGLPVISVVGNDAGWTQIMRDQVPILGDDVATTLAYTDYHKVAEGFGAKGLLLDDPAKTEETLAEAVRLSREGHPVLLNVIIGKTDFRKGSISM